MKRLVSGLCLVCLFSSWIAATAFAADEKLTNASVIEMHKLGLGDSVVIEKIKASACNFDVGLDALKQLKEAGVSDAIIQAMIAAGSPAKPGAAPVAAAPAGDPNDPKASHKPGIWLYQELDGKPKMSRLEASLFTQARTGSAWGAGFGADMKTRAVLQGAHSPLQLAESKPVFYFYFEATETGLSEAAPVRTNPGEFTLAKLEVRQTQKYDERRLVVGKYNAYAGGSSGVEKKSAVPFDSEQIAEGVYKVTPKNDLQPGEYGFLYSGAGAVSPFGFMMVGGAGGGGRVFDFGIK